VKLILRCGSYPQTNTVKLPFLVWPQRTLNQWVIASLWTTQNLRGESLH
jgi:hypothetical protein